MITSTGPTRRRISAPPARVLAIAALLLASAMGMSAHLIRSLEEPSIGAFVSSPTTGSDAPIRLVWAGSDTGLRVACFNVANTSQKDPAEPDWPRVTSVGFELPGSSTGFSLLAPLSDDWRLVEGGQIAVGSGEPVTLDFAIVANVNPTGRANELRGIAPGNPATRDGSTRFCVSGPFPDRLPDLFGANPDVEVATTIEGLINGVVVGFHGVHGLHQGTDAGVWFTPSGSGPRPIPLYP